eukprot:1143475-Pelagomonas_calceolata.AAC.2
MTWPRAKHTVVCYHGLYMSFCMRAQAHELQGLAITMSDFEAAVSKVQPSVRREGFATTPDVTWEDVGSLDENMICQRRVAIMSEIGLALCTAQSCCALFGPDYAH